MAAVKPDAARGEFGAWLRKQRTARFKTAAIASRFLQAEAGYGIAPSVWGELESGTRRPSADQRRVLLAYFGSQPEPLDDPLVRALREQTAVFRDLVDELRLMRAEQAATQEASARVLGRLAGTLEAVAPSSGAEHRQGRDL